jgi:hypothetical protein
VHDDDLTLFQTRWAMSYLKGPLSREELRMLGARDGQAGRVGQIEQVEQVVENTPAMEARPVVGPGVPQFFAPAGGAAGPVWRPYLYAAATLHFVDRKQKVDLERTVARVAPITDAPVPVDWNDSSRVELLPESLSIEPPTDRAQFEVLPAAAAKASNYKAWARQWNSWVAANETIDLLKNPSTGLVSRPDESERDFRARVQQAAREARDAKLDALRKRYAPKQATLENRLLRAQQAIARESEQASSHRLQTAISFGATVLGAVLGRRIGVGTLGRATTAARGASRTMKEAQDVERARETLGSVEEEQRRLEEAFQEDAAALDSTVTAGTEALEPITIRPRKTDVHTKLVALVWKR